MSDPIPVSVPLTADQVRRIINGPTRHENDQYDRARAAVDLQIRDRGAGLMKRRGDLERGVPRFVAEYGPENPPGHQFHDPDPAHFVHLGNRPADPSEVRAYWEKVAPELASIQAELITTGTDLLAFRQSADKGADQADRSVWVVPSYVVVPPE